MVLDESILNQTLSAGRSLTDRVLRSLISLNTTSNVSGEVDTAQ